MTPKKRALSLRQAQECENAITPHCECRCGGQFHGTKRGGVGIPNAAFFDALPDDDPHSKPTKERKKQQKRTKQESTTEQVRERLTNFYLSLD